MATSLSTFEASADTSNIVPLCKLLLPTSGITAASATLPFQLPILPDQPQLRVNEAKPSPNVALT